jgi:predicted naringenin-chalcone synthase
LGTSVPQQRGITWLKNALQRSRDDHDTGVRRALELYDELLRANHISSRATCLTDYTHEDWDEMTLFHATGDEGTPWYCPSLQKRMAVFDAESHRLVREAFRDDVEAPHAAFQVSCTGYASPHALQRVICDNGWGTRFWHIGHMGCYAAIPALAIAGHFVGDESRASGASQTGSVLFIELCTLHLRPQIVREDQVVMNTLFADGSIRVDVSSHEERSTFAVLGTGEAMIPDTTSEMTWTLADSAFEMVLARSIPVHIGRDIASFVDGFLRRFDLGRDDIAHYAIHPGGPRIIEMVARRLALREGTFRHSLQVLRERGNMSSATLPHIWWAMQEDPEVGPGDRVLSLAFGPGLTVTANVLQRLE